MVDESSYLEAMTRDDVIARLKGLEPQIRAHGVAALYLYGSYARDEAGPDSDIDLLADFDEGRDADIMDFLAPYEALESAFPGMEIGFSTRDRLVPVYRPFIESSAVRVF
ncbi:nucleotidyltransferase family protein [Jiella avicenniae]|uniref:Nucleotidyltransferase domain-containing protein n=1 Tax=Jiella avicenniae TaxID=2907202 RepID=A0A9X1P1L2_9HYPH|nr:nucleotidyltransferase domain-containing protein [Jiella avicenniae]MCE7029737.1 nucleotidyltransferase domain-containing protein [Jiella avicenniae]